MTHIQPTPEFLENKDLRLIFFGGKGGVGKTTMAAAAALHLAGSRGGEKKVLVISTDPAHSLSDSFGIEIGDRVTPVEWPGVRGQGSVTNLFSRELDANRLLEDFKEKNNAVIQKLAERGTYFDKEDIADFFDLSLPGMDEVMAIIEMADLLKEGAYDVLIVDTAPTGHTVRMLNLPEQMRKWVEVMDLMQHKHRYMFRHFTGKKYIKDECDVFLDDLSSDMDRVVKLLSNADETRFVPVMIPEFMSIDETKRLVRSLEKIHVPIKEVVVNRVAESDGCRFCRSKKEDQKQSLMEIDDAFSTYGRIRVPLFPNEIRGLEGLKRTVDYLLLGRPIPSTPLIILPAVQESHACLSLNPDLEFILCGGKGGVGKTSLASAAGLHLAQQYPEKKILVFSTDPAHSLSDSLEIQIGDAITPIQRAEDSNLFALEIDADRLWTDFKDAFQKDIQGVFDSFLARGTDIKFDREVMTQLLELAPPGLDEIMSLDRMMDLRKAGDFDIFVLDTSPTGHLLRFLELPHLVRKWLQAFFRLLLKYKGVVRLTGAAEKALALSKNVRKIQESLVDTQKTRFVAVTIPERMGFLELERLVSALEKTNVPCEHIIINMVLPPTNCGFCAHKRMEQQDCIQKVHSRFPAQTVVQAPFFPNPVRGVSDLRKITTVFCKESG
jgi:arsenite-transporting ATPase